MEFYVMVIFSRAASEERSDLSTHYAVWMYGSLYVCSLVKLLGPPPPPPPRRNPLPVGNPCYKNISGLRIAHKIRPRIVQFISIQDCHMSGKSQGKTKFSPGQGIVREFCHDN